MQLEVGSHFYYFSSITCIPCIIIIINILIIEKQIIYYCFLLLKVCKVISFNVTTSGVNNDYILLVRYAPHSNLNKGRLSGK